jgi:hypothetical protein
MNNIKCFLGFHDYEDIEKQFITMRDIFKHIKDIIEDQYNKLDEDIRNLIHLSDCYWHLNNYFIGGTLFKRREEEKVYRQVCIRCGKLSSKPIEEKITEILNKVQAEYDKNLHRYERKIKANKLSSTDKDKRNFKYGEAWIRLKPFNQNK